MKRLIGVTTLLMFILGMGILPAFAGRDIPDNNLAIPVLIKGESVITGKKVFASGFYGKDDNSIYLVTARHVLFSDQGKTLKSNYVDLLSYPDDPKLPGVFIVTVDLVGLLKINQIRVHEIHDVAIVRLGSIDDKNIFIFQQGVSWKQKVVNKQLVLNNLVVASKRYDEVFEANEAYLFGYPIILGIESAQLDPERPLLRKGIVAGRNPMKRTLVVDCPAYYGNSGGPVLEVEQVDLKNKKFRIIGVVSEYVPFVEHFFNMTSNYTSGIQYSNSGYAIVIPMDFVLELLWKK